MQENGLEGSCVGKTVVFCLARSFKVPRCYGKVVVCLSATQRMLGASLGSMCLLERCNTPSTANLRFCLMAKLSILVPVVEAGSLT